MFPEQGIGQLGQTERYVVGESEGGWKKSEFMNTQLFMGADGLHGRAEKGVDFPSKAKLSSFIFKKGKMFFFYSSPSFSSLSLSLSPFFVTK